MPNQILHHHPVPLILHASQDTRQAGKLATALTSAGFRVVRTHTEHDTLEVAQRQRPHAIVLDVNVAPPGYGLCRTLRAVSLGTPIVLTCDRQPTHDAGIEALRAGAWGLRGTPIDTQEFALRLAAYMEPKLELDRLSEECLVDRVSGLYNHLGVTRRADELAALATRHGLALACMVFRPADERASRATTDLLAHTFRSVGRASDAVGRTGRAEFAVFAPASNSWAAGRLVHRLIDRASGYGKGISMRSGYSASSPAQKISSLTLLTRARSALEAPGSP